MSLLANVVLHYKCGQAMQSETLLRRGKICLTSAGLALGAVGSNTKHVRGQSTYQNKEEHQAQDQGYPMQNMAPRGRWQ